MAQKVKKLALFLLAFLFLSSLACSRQGTEVGSPGTSRTINGKLVASSNQGLQAVKQQSEDDDEFESCPAANGPISVLLINPDDDTISSNVAQNGNFSSDILQSDRYEIQFAQNGEVCGFLIYPDSENLNGLRVTLGRGNLDIDLGDVTDLGGGLFISSINPSDFCDDDFDGIFDNDDFDDDGDGFFDTDADFDGYLDWFDDDDDGDGIFDEDEEGEEEADECDVAYVYPSFASGLVVEPDGFTEIEIFPNQEIASVNAPRIKILDAFDDIVVTFSSSDVTIENEDDPVALLGTNLDPDTDYLLVIEAGAITCEDNNQNQDDVEIEFRTFED